MDHTLSAKTVKFTSLENLYEYGMFISRKAILWSLISDVNLIDEWNRLRDQ